MTEPLQKRDKGLRNEGPFSLNALFPYRLHITELVQTKV